MQRDDVNLPKVPDSVKASADEPQSFGAWLLRSGPLLAIVFGLAIYLYLQFDWYGLGAIAKAFLGLSFVVFFHELGHFLAAKWCNVHVTTFSIGFGPAIPGCSFKWGETTYKFSLLPLGGYVQMVGQIDGDESSDDSEDDPRSYRNKSVGQRMLIISAGVIMNVILAIVCFVIVYLGPGKDRLANVIAEVDSGSEAFRQGIRPGAQILKIGDIKDPHFEALTHQVMATHQDEKLDFVFQRPQDDHATAIKIEPRKGENDVKPMIGIGFPSRLELENRGYMDPGMPGPFYPGSAASKASPGFEWGDKIVGMTDPKTGQVKLLETDKRVDKASPNYGQKDYFEFWQRMVDLAGQEVTIRVERGNPQSPETVDLRVPPAYRTSLGMRMEMGQITEIRLGSPADNKVRIPQNGLEGDVIVKVEAPEPHGKSRQSWDDQTLDPERLPFELREWAKRMAKAKVPPDKWVVTLTVRRHRALAGEQYIEEPVHLTWDDSWKYDRVTPLNGESPMPIPELGLAFRIKATVASVTAGASHAESLQRGDVVKQVRINMDVKGEEKEGTWIELKPDQWTWFVSNLQRYSNIRRVDLKVSRNKDEKEKEITITPVADKTWPSPELGLIFQRDLRRQRASNLLEAINMGLTDTYDNVTRVFQNIKAMATGRVSIKMLSGPISIARFAYLFALVDSWEFVFFLGMISINLAVINFLPIPVLDGGHMVFLLYEKIRGKPASEGVRASATYAGLALILCLMVFVFYLDISRLFG